MHDAIVSRIKILANMNIAERRRPQDGRLAIQEYDIDVRVSIIPTIHGEKVQMRFLDKNRLVLDFASLGLNDAHRLMYEEVLRRSQGMILVTGPTGSGKTTTLYSGLAFVNTPGKQIMTVEDPVEYVFPTINQIRVHAEIDLTFDTILRSILRQDPDIIMVGEIRDQETGEIAVRASLTGHLVLSTLHTVSAVSAINRLISMGVKPYLLGSSLSLIIAQRLVRRLCARCVTQDDPAAASLEQLRLDPAGKCFTGKGCRYCNGAGYRGQVAIFELLSVSRPIAHLISGGAPEGDIETAAEKAGMVTLAQSAAEKVRDGVTSVEEVLARIVVMPDPPVPQESQQ
jgi:type IV pilus assembly protein PilB